MAASKNSGKIRYAVVGLGHIVQVAVLPAFAHVRSNSQLTALVSGDPEKRKSLGRRYKVDQLFSYDEYGDCLSRSRDNAVSNASVLIIGAGLAGLTAAYHLVGSRGRRQRDDQNNLLAQTAAGIGNHNANGPALQGRV